MSTFQGYYITTKGVDEICNRILQIQKIGNRKANNDRELKVLRRTYCEQTYRLLEDCFEPNMWGIERTKNLLKKDKDSDNKDILCHLCSIANCILIDIFASLGTIIPLKDFPSCKDLLNMDKDLAIKYAKDLVQNKIIKDSIHRIALVSKANDFVTIVDIWNFYASIIKELEREVREENWPLSSIEQALLSKARSECWYCYQAMLKTGYNITDEIKEMVGENRADKCMKVCEDFLINNEIGFVPSQIVAAP